MNIELDVAAAGEIVDEVLIAPGSDRTDDLRRIESVLLHLEQLGIVTRLVVNFLPTRLPHPHAPIMLMWQSEKS